MITTKIKETKKLKFIKNFKKEEQKIKKHIKRLTEELKILKKRERILKGKKESQDFDEWIKKCRET